MIRVVSEPLPIAAFADADDGARELVGVFEWQRDEHGRLTGDGVIRWRDRPIDASPTSTARST